MVYFFKLSELLTFFYFFFKSILQERSPSPMAMVELARSPPTVNSRTTGRSLVKMMSSVVTLWVFMKLFDFTQQYCHESQWSKSVAVQDPSLISCCFFIQDFESEDQVEMAFTKNGKWLGPCYCIPREELAGRPLFPHILVKNCGIEFNFGQREEPYFPPPPGYTYIQDLPLQDRSRGTVGPATKAECEVALSLNNWWCLVCYWSSL